jgi:hypothetical protein
MNPYILSIEVTEGCAERHGFHLGTALPLAMQIAEERFHARRRAGLPVLTVALLRDGKLVDVYYGDSWDSDL